MPHTWTHELPMRWADLDILNHVTNVVYVDYAAEGQALLRHDGVLPDLGPVRDVTVTYLRPTALSRKPLLLRAGLDGDVLTQEVCTQSDDEPRLHARVVTTHGDPVTPDLPAPDHEPLPIRVRSGDLDASGVASVTGQFRVAQDARILHLASRMDRERLGPIVVGTLSMQPLRPLTWRPEPWESRTWVSRVGTGSFTMQTLVGPLDAPFLASQAALVGFDADTQTARKLSEVEVELLRGHVR